jgi:hypothetical protein
MLTSARIGAHGATLKGIGQPRRQLLIQQLMRMAAEADRRDTQLTDGK